MSASEKPAYLKEKFVKPTGEVPRVIEQPIQEESLIDIQEQPPWEDFETDALNDHLERRPPTEEEIVRMNHTLTRLGEVMSLTEARWQLDGATNISLYNEGEYIGVHKDVDLSIEPDDLALFEADMFRRGYAFFDSLSRADDKSPRKLKRISADDILSGKTGHSLLLMHIDAKGKIVTNEELDAVDLHIIKRDDDGRALGLKGQPLPEKWLQARKLATSGGVELNASHPARVLYYKLHQGREYDFTDLDRLAKTGALSPEDVNEVQGVLMTEQQAEIQRIERAVSPMVNEIASATDTNGIFEAFRLSPEIGSKIDDSDKKESLRKLAERFLQTRDKSKDGLIREVMSFTDLENQQHRRFSVLERLRGHLADREKIQQLRTEMGVATESGHEAIEGFDAGLTRLKSRAAELLKLKERILVIISGKSGSGKSEMSQRMQQDFLDDKIATTVISTDDFYVSDDPKRPQDKHLDLDRLQDTITELQAGRSVDRYQPASVIIVEGLQAIDDQVVGQRPDVRAYVEADFGQRIGRRMVRDARIGYRDFQTSLEMVAKIAVENPDVFQTFEQTPDMKGVDIGIQNDYVEPNEPAVTIRGDQLIFTLNGKVQAERKLNEIEKQAVLKLGFEES